MNVNKPVFNIEGLAAALNGALPGSAAHERMRPAGRSLDLPPSKKSIKTSAVMALLYRKENEIYICLTKRNKALRHHPGQISFPGGRAEENEIQQPLKTALRETHEEIGIAPAEIELLGSLSPLYVPVSNFMIYPYVGYCEHEPDFVVNHQEVDQLLTIPVRELLNTQNQINQKVNTSLGNIDVPCYQIDGHIVWGATSMILAELEAILRQHYSHRAIHSDNVHSDPTP